jgi:hypothetical protein
VTYAAKHRSGVYRMHLADIVEFVISAMIREKTKMCDKHPECEHTGSHSEFVTLNLLCEQAEYEGKDLEVEDMEGLFYRAKERREIRFKERWK